jgi:hypothetical protein
MTSTYLEDNPGRITFPQSLWLMSESARGAGTASAPRPKVCVEARQPGAGMTPAHLAVVTGGTISKPSFNP